MNLIGFNSLSLDYLCVKIRFMGVDFVVDCAIQFNACLRNDDWTVKNLYNTYGRRECDFSA